MRMCPEGQESKARSRKHRNSAQKTRLYTHACIHTYYNTCTCARMCVCVCAFLHNCSVSISICTVLFACRTGKTAHNTSHICILTQGRNIARGKFWGSPSTRAPCSWSLTRAATQSGPGSYRTCLFYSCARAPRQLDLQAARCV